MALSERACPRVISARRWRRCWGRTPRACRPRRITRLKADWWSEYEAWEKPRTSVLGRFLYIWADGVYFKPRMAEEKNNAFW